MPAAKCRLAWFYLLLAIPSFALSSQFSKDRPPAQQAGNAFLIDPKESVGQITPTCSERDLIRIYGAQNVRRADIDAGEGETEKGTILFPGTPDAVEILWKRPFSHPTCLIISSPKTRWRTAEGITVGTTAAKIEKINRFPFRLTGFGWDYEGRSMSWGKGTLPRELVLDFQPTCKVSAADDRAVCGDGEFSSAHPAMLRKKLAVVSLRVFWRWPNNDLWNLMPAAPSVNMSKSDKLPSAACLEKARNQIMDWWHDAYGGAAYLDRFQAEATASLPIARVAVASDPFEKAFSGLQYQRIRLRADQQLAERDWSGRNHPVASST